MSLILLGLVMKRLNYKLTEAQRLNLSPFVLRFAHKLGIL